MWLEGDELCMAFLESEWLRKKVRQSGLAFAEVPGNRVLITAPTADLRRFVQAHGTDAQAADDVVRLRRLR